MSNESENKRIDTSKYDGHRNGPWWTDEWFNDNVVQFDKGYCVEQRIVNESPVVDHSGEWICLVDNEADAKLIADTPEILAELKRCYEKEDEAKAIREYIEMYIGEMSAEELLEDILTGAYMDEPEVWKTSE